MSIRFFVRFGNVIMCRQFIYSNFTKKTRDLFFDQITPLLTPPPAPTTTTTQVFTFTPQPTPTTTRKVFTSTPPLAPTTPKNTTRGQDGDPHIVSFDGVHFDN
jgi:hypothetical protein